MTVNKEFSRAGLLGGKLVRIVCKFHSFWNSNVQWLKSEPFLKKSNAVYTASLKDVSLDGASQA